MVRDWGSTGCGGERLAPRYLEKMGEGRRESRHEEEFGLDMLRLRGQGTLERTLLCSEG